MPVDTDALKASVDIAAVVGQYVPLRKQGSEYIGLCPFHADKNPSFYVVPAKRMCHCFSCDAHHDVISFLQEIEGLDFKAACERLGAKTDWKPNLTAPKRSTAPKPDRITSKPPPDAGAPDMELRGLGQPSRIWPYRDSDGSVLGYVARYDVEGKKEIRCWTWGSRGAARPSWGCGHWSKPRPLYGLQKLAQYPERPVMVVEGEKAADAAQQLLPHYVVVTWPGGAKALKHADLEPLRGRRVDLWPDNDEAGVEAMQELRAVLGAADGLACRGKFIDPNRMPDGFDAADWAEEHGDLMTWLRSRASDYPAAEQAPAPKLAEAPQQPATDQGPAFPPAEAYASEPDGNLAGDDDDEAIPVELSEDAFASKFADQHGENWRCVKAWGKWFNWDGEAWAEDRTDSRVDPMRAIFRAAQYSPAARSVSEAARRSVFGKQVPMYSALRLAGTDRRIRAEPEIWDADPWALGVPGGVIDLKTGRLMASARDQHVTMRCSIAPAAGKPKLWLAMLDQWLGADQDVIGFLRRYLGYALTGDSREQCMAFFYGPAQSGKGTVMRAISGILGSINEGHKFRSYHYEAPISTFMESRSDRHSTELAAFYKKRLITSEEPAAGAKWDEGKLKWITGGSQITARFIAQDNFSFTMTGKIIVAANHRPRLSTTDKAIRRRMMVIPFEHPVADEDRDNLLDAKLRAEWPQILNWMIEGSLDWQQQGLGLPEAIAAKTDEYLEAEDTLGAWLAECCGREFDTDGAFLYKNYSEWCERNGDNAWTRRAWSNALLERGFKTRKGAQGARMICDLNIQLGSNIP